jgi:hypothetical protein
MDKIVPTSISSCRGKIPGPALLHFHKNIRQAFAPFPEKGVSVSQNPTFSAKNTEMGHWPPVSVTQFLSLSTRGISGKWQGFSRGPPEEIPGFAVEKANFSTISTGLSTSFFHRPAVKNPDIQFT